MFLVATYIQRQYATRIYVIYVEVDICRDMSEPVITCVVFVRYVFACILFPVTSAHFRGVVLKKKWGRLKQDLDKDF